MVEGCRPSGTGSHGSVPILAVIDRENMEAISKVEIVFF